MTQPNKTAKKSSLELTFIPAEFWIPEVQEFVRKLPQ